MSDGELDLIAIQHRQRLVLRLHSGIGAFEVDGGEPLLKHRGIIYACDQKLRLEDPCGVAQLLRFLLAVDQKQRDAPVVVAFADDGMVAFSSLLPAIAAHSHSLTDGSR